MSSREVRVVLLGKTGGGKSSLGNTLLGREAFRVARGMSSGTEKCQWADADHLGLTLQVTDTPGLCDTHRDEQDVLREVGKSVAVAAPGPHVVLMVLRCDKRFTEEEYLAYKTLKNLFGPEICNYMIVVFSGADTLGDTVEAQNAKLKKDVAKAPPQLAQVLDDSNRRYTCVNNVAGLQSERDLQAQKVIRMIQELMTANGGRYFSNKLSEDVSGIKESLVQQEMRNNNASRAAATKSANQAIVDESAPGVIDNLADAIAEAVRASVKYVANAVKETAEKVRKSCSVM